MLHRKWLALGLAIPLAVSSAARAQNNAPGGGVLATEPKSPVEQFDAAVTMLKLSRPELARQYLAALLAGNPDDATLFAIRDKHGTGTLVQMSRMEELQPESLTLLELLNTAAQNQLADPAFQASLLRDLNGSLRQRETAIDTLQALGEQAPPLLIGRIAAGATGNEEVQLMQALLRLGSIAEAPLTAALYSSNAHLQNVAADLLGRMEAKSAALPLAVLAFDAQTPASLKDAARTALARIQYGGPQFVHQVTNLRLLERLKHEASACLSQRAETAVGEDGLVALWTWSDAAGTVMLSRVSQTSLHLQRGEEWSRGAVRLSPEDAEAQALLLAHLLWRDVQTAGWGQPTPNGPGTAHNVALTLAPQVVERTLRLALEQNNPAATIGALSVLAHTGSRSSLLSAGSPLLAALDAPESRLQFAAAETILQLDPQQPFAGAGRVVEVLVRALSGEHLPKTVVIDPNTDRGAALAGLISTLGYVPGLASTGQQGFEMATQQGNVELAVLHLNTVRWDLSQTLANLRADPRTRRIPIAVYGPPELRGATYPKLQPYQLVGYIDDGSDAGTLRQQLTPLLAARAVPELTEAQRIAQVSAAAYWLRHIAEGQRTGVFPLQGAESALLKAADQTAIARDVLIALGSIGKPAVQQRMADVALSAGLSVETRRAAIVQLAFHLQKFGRMVSNETAQRVGSAYQNESSAELKTLWAAVVGALRPDPQGAGGVLLSYPPPAAPLP